MDWFTTTTLWYLYLFIIGIIFAPLAKKIFGQFYDNGYPFAKTLGIIFTSYVVFVLGLLKILPFTRGGILFILLIFGVFFYWKKFRFRFPDLKKYEYQKLFLLTFEEILFFASLIALTFVRGQESSIHGLEKFMDYGFMMSILKSQYFPPLDMWLSADPSHMQGYAINYYYFGHLTGALLIKLSQIPSTIGYNLILATIFAQGMTLIFSLVGNTIYLFQKYILKVQKIHLLSFILFGLLGSVLVNLGGNLHTIYIFTNGYPNEKPVPFWTIFQTSAEIAKTMTTEKLDFLGAMVRNAGYWYPNATRFIPYTIHEFPSYSYVVADLHGHVFDIPFVILTFAVLFHFFVQFYETSVSKKYVVLPDFSHIIAYLRKNISTRIYNIRDPKLLTAIFIGFLTSVHYMTNALDGPIYLLLTIIIFFLVYQVSFNFIFYTAITGLSFYIFSRPFSFFFSPFASGIGVNCSPDFLVNMKKIGLFLFEKNNCQVSEVWMLGVLWGFFWISALLLATVLFIQKKINKFDIFVLVIFAFGTFLIFIPEFFYVKDIYPQHFRANTMFKLGYQAFIMMGIGSIYVLYRIKILSSKSKYILKIIYFVFLVLVLIYPFFAFPSYYPGLYISETYKKSPQLDGSLWLLKELPADKEIIDFINTEITGQPVILEAPGDSYTNYERISAYTGLPTVAGWWVHEWLWRGSSDVVGNRLADITNMYESQNIEITKNLLKKYHVKYIVVSGLEKSKYPNLKEEKFSEIGLKIFESNDRSGALYRVNQ